MDSTRWDSTPKDLDSLEQKQASEIVQKMLEELVDKVVAAFKDSEEYFLNEKEHPLFSKIPANTAMRALYLALNNKGILLDPLSLLPDRGVTSYHTGFLLKKKS